MRDQESKVLIAWTAWVLVLSGISAGSYRYWPREDEPVIVLEVVGKKQLDDGPVELKFALNRPLDRPIKLQYRVEFEGLNLRRADPLPELT